MAIRRVASKSALVHSACGNVRAKKAIRAAGTRWLFSSQTTKSEVDRTGFQLSFGETCAQHRERRNSVRGLGWKFLAMMKGFAMFDQQNDSTHYVTFGNESGECLTNYFPNVAAAEASAVFIANIGKREGFDPSPRVSELTEFDVEEFEYCSALD